MIALAGAGAVAPDARASVGWVAKVGTAQIKTTSFVHRLGVDAKQAGRRAFPRALPNSPSYRSCLAKRRSDRFCLRVFREGKGDAMSQLIYWQWLRSQASEMGIAATRAEVDKKLQETKRGLRLSEKAYRDLLRKTGQTDGDVRIQVKTGILADRILTRVKESVGEPSDLAVSTWFERNKADFGTPEKRDYRCVVAESRAAALAAKAALEAGRSWKQVALKYSVDPWTRRSGGLVTGAVSGEEDAPLDEIVFSSGLNRIRGPIRGSFGIYYIVAVLRIEPAVIPTLAQVRDEVVKQLKSVLEDRALTAFLDSFRKTWSSRTTCRKAFAIRGYCSKIV